MIRPSICRLAVCVAVIWVTLGIANEAGAELFLSGYLGVSSTYDSDVELNRPGGASLTFSDVSWDDKSFESPQYYGMRVGYWFNSHPNWALAIDFTHAKMHSDPNQTVSISGTRDGVPVSRSERLGDTFEELSFSHGNNLLIFNGMYRWMDLGQSDQDSLNRLQPYVLAGLGFAYPHVEVSVAGSHTYEYQTTGIAAQAGAGLDVDINRWFSVFAEYRLSYAQIDADLEGGGTLKTEPWTHHITFGVTISWLH